MRRNSSGGSVLLETLVAVAILVGCGTVIMAASDRGDRLLRRSRELAHAADLARSAIAAIEAGVVTPQAAAASVRNGPGGAAWLAVDADNGLPESPEGEGRWRLDVQVEPSNWEGLTRVEASVFDRSSPEGAPAVYAMTQLVRMVPEGTDSAGESLLKGSGSRSSLPARAPGRTPARGGAR